MAPIWSRCEPQTGTKGLGFPPLRLVKFTFSLGWWLAPGLKGGLLSRLVAPTGIKGLVLAWWKFSPTSPSERHSHLFISPAAISLPSSSLKQAVHAQRSSLPSGAYLPCRPASWPIYSWVSSRMQAVVA
jgi:hypothetical protein